MIWMVTDKTELVEVLCNDASLENIILHSGLIQENIYKWMTSMNVLHTCGTDHQTFMVKIVK